MNGALDRWIKLFKRLLKESQFDIEFETSALSVQKLCSIESFNFSTLTCYNSETREFWAKQNQSSSSSSIIDFHSLKAFNGLCNTSYK
jgi:predicted nucleic-acid-binding Zn-ribbon protein